MNKRVLFVDDESNVLDAIKRAIRKDCDVSIASGPEEGIAALTNQPEFALIVSDMRMPGMDGVEFLRTAKALSPYSVRMMLTGNADQQTAVAAVNDGEVYRYLTKPCDVDGLRQAVSQGLRQYELITAEKTLLEQTLSGSIAVLTDCLSLARPDVFGRSNQLHARVSELVREVPGLDRQELWAIDTAARLCQIGCVSLRASTLAKLKSGEALDEAEQLTYYAGADRAADLLERIPHLDEVAVIIRYQHKQYSGEGWPEDSMRADSIPVGSRALYLAMAEQRLIERGFDEAERIEELQRRSGEFDPHLLEYLVAKANGVSVGDTRHIEASQLEVGMQIADDVSSSTGSLLVCAGQVVTNAVANHLAEIHKAGGIDQQIEVVARPGDEQNEVVNG